MRRTDPRDAAALLLTAGALLIITVASHAQGWLAAAAAGARSPLVPALAGAVAAGCTAVLLARAVLVRRSLRRRARSLLLPTDRFDPEPGAVARFASALVRVRRPLAGIFDAPASAVRVQLDADVYQHRLLSTSGRRRPCRVAADGPCSAARPVGRW
jgi:hypothetical protein